MLRKIAVLLVVLAMGLAAFPAQAQGDANAYTNYELNMRAASNADGAVVAIVPANQALVLEARSSDNQWVLGHTPDGAQRGWLASLYLRYAEGFNAFNLPESTETLAATETTSEPAADTTEQPAEQAQAAPSGDGTVNATPNYLLNVRSGPGTGHAIVGEVQAGTALIVEGRNADTTWVLMHAQNGSVRGWISTDYLAVQTGSIYNLPETGEFINVPLSVASGGDEGNTNPSFDGIPMGGFNPNTVAGIDLTAYPPVGRATSRSYTIYQEGRALGNQSNVVSKVGDCSTEHWHFLRIFQGGPYNLGAYTNLQGVVDHFNVSLGVDSEASHNGFNVNVVGAEGMANPAYCEADESPLTCEYRLRMPAISIIMFGTSDLLVMTPYDYDFYLRSAVEQTIERGIIPVVSTFPGNTAYWDRTLLYNKIVVRVALDYDIPLINLWLALEDLPNHGLEPDGLHLGAPITLPGDLTEANLQSGYGMRNLITLQTIDNIWRSVLH